MPPTTSFDFGAVVLLPFPFTNQTTTKKRPAVVVSSPAYNCERPDRIVLAITSQAGVPNPSFGEARVGHWREAGLIRLSVFKPLLATVECRLILRQLGKLQPPDLDSLHALLRWILGRPEPAPEQAPEQKIS